MSAPGVIVIGAGMAGLAAGCRARQAGLDTVILEQAAEPGGLVYGWKRGGYVFDGCLHFLLGCNEVSSYHGLYKALGLVDALELEPMASLENFINAISGFQFEVTSDKEGTRQRLLAMSPEDTDYINEFFDRAEAAGKLPMPVDTPDMMSPEQRQGIEAAWDNVFSNREEFSMPAQQHAMRVKHPFVREIFTYFFESHMPVIFHYLLAGWFWRGELSMVKGGSMAVTNALVAKFAALGGELRCSASVNEIMVENGRAVGVRLADGSEHRADAVIAASDLNGTLYGMLGGQHVPQRLERMFATWPMFPSIMLLSYGVRGEGKSLPPVSLYINAEPVEIDPVYHHAIGMLVRDFGHDASFAPEGCKVVQVTIGADYDYWTGLRNSAPVRYKKEKSVVAERVLKSIEHLYPGMSERVEVTDVATPATFYRYTRNYKGSFEGWMFDLESVFNPIERKLPTLEGLYLAGQWVEPGGGIPQALVSGHRAVSRLCSDLGIARAIYSLEPVR